MTSSQHVKKKKGKLGGHVITDSAGKAVKANSTDGGGGGGGRRRRSACASLSQLAD